MFDPKEIASDTIKNAFRKGLFSQSSKIIRIEHSDGINILEQSAKNYKALLHRLSKRTQIPEIEKAQYGTSRLSLSETDFFRYWLGEICPLFTARHGTEHIAYIQKTGCLMPVADRRRENKLHQNSRTGGFARQEHNYFVLGLGDAHPVPISVSNSKTITLYFNRMNPVEKKQFSGMFISGHLIDYQRDLTYPIVLCGDTEVKVNYDKQTKLRTTTFKRKDGRIIKEYLSYADEIVVANPTIDVIFEWLGYKFIEYLRFIGGEFQADILNCKDPKKIATVFHALFPSYRFPELKIPLKIPISANYVKISPTEEIHYKDIAAFHEACTKFQLNLVSALIRPSIANAKNQKEDSPLFVLLDNFKPHPSLLQLVKLLLDNGADVNFNSLIKSILSLALGINDPQLLSVIVQGHSNPDCPTLRILPKVGYAEMRQIIESHNLTLFNQFYPLFLEYGKAQELLEVARKNTRQTELKSYTAKQKEQYQAEFENSLIILERILSDCDPNNTQCNENHICMAAQHGQQRVIRAFLAHKQCNINQTITSNTSLVSSYEGWNALHFACWKGHVDIATDLVIGGIDLNATSYFGLTPLDIAEKVLSSEMDFMSAQERKSEQLQNHNLKHLLGEIEPKALSNEQQIRYQEIIKMLKQKEAKNGVFAESQHKPTKKNYAAIVCVVAEYKNTRYTLLVRKKNSFDLPLGHYLFPGGFLDNQRDNGSFVNAGVREVLEETGVNISEAIVSVLAEYDCVAQESHNRRHFILADLGTVNRLPRCIPNSDVAEALWVNSQRIKEEDVNDQHAMYLNNVAISHSNSLILSKIFKKTLPDPQVLIDSQIVIYESKLMPIISVLFYFLILEFNSEELDILYNTISEVIDQLVSSSYLPKYLKESLVAILLAMKSHQVEQAVELIQKIVIYVTKIGLYHVDELIFNKMNLFQNCCRLNKPEQLRFLIAQGADPNRMIQVGFNAYSPLSMCFGMNAMESAEVLLNDSRVEINLGDSTENALTIACQNPNIGDDFIEAIIQKIGIIPDFQLGTLVHELLKNKRFALLDKLLTQYPLDLNQKYSRSQSLATDALPLMTAINIYSLEATNILIKHGADITIPYTTDLSLLQFAQSLKLQLKFSRKVIIAHLPTHKKHQRYKTEISLLDRQNSLADKTEQQIQQSLTENEEQLSELEKIIELIESQQPSLELNGII